VISRTPKFSNFGLILKHWAFPSLRIPNLIATSQMTKFSVSFRNQTNFTGLAITQCSTSNVHTDPLKGSQNWIWKFYLFITRPNSAPQACHSPKRVGTRVWLFATELIADSQIECSIWSDSSSPHSTISKLPHCHRSLLLPDNLSVLLNVDAPRLAQPSLAARRHMYLSPNSTSSVLNPASRSFEIHKPLRLTHNPSKPK